MAERWALWMSTVRLHPAEEDRLDALRSYGILDSAPEPQFDQLAALAAHVCGTPIAAIALVDADRQWFKASTGAGQLGDTPRAWAFCSDVVADGAMLVVPDARRNRRYRDNPLVTGQAGIRAFAGAPLVGRDGLPLGALCVIDTRPRAFDAQSLSLLSVLAGQAVVLLEERRRDREAGLLAESVVGEAREVTRLRKALDAGELVAHYQPLVDIVTASPYGCEALLRWEHPTLGLLSPAAFLPLIENTALVVPVGRTVLDQALGQAATLRALGLPGGMAVNVAGGQLARRGLAMDMFAALERHAVAPENLALEITETTGLADEQLAIAELRVLSDAGVQIVLDDFGVGWSNYARLLSLPVTAIKIDRSIAAAVVTDSRASKLVAAIVNSAFQLGVDVVAEGVETVAVRRRLRSLGVRWAQGWLFGAAQPASRLVEQLDRSALRDGPAVTADG